MYAEQIQMFEIIASPEIGIKSDKKIYKENMMQKFSELPFKMKSKLHDELLMKLRVRFFHFFC